MLCLDVFFSIYIANIVSFASCMENLFKKGKYLDQQDLQPFLSWKESDNWIFVHSLVYKLMKNY